MGYILSLQHLNNHFFITKLNNIFIQYSCFSKMEQGYDNRLSVSLDELCFNAENGSTNRRIMNKKHYDDDGNKVFTSKNLETERKRRMKLSARLLKLRSLVPIITNVTA